MAETRAPVPRHYGLLLPAALAVVLAGGLLLAQRRIDFTVNEEGFLWYGAVAVAHGDVPFRDFYSYDPGRYYWAAAWMPVAGEGLLGLRLATSAFAAVGLFCGLLAARRAVRSPLALAALGIVLTLWLVPRNKLYEPAITMAAVLAAVTLIERPTARRHLAAGALVGGGVFMGKNHGLYLGVAFLALILLLHWRRGDPAATGEASEAKDANRTDDVAAGWRGLLRHLAHWTAGIALGATPLLAMFVLIPGFARSYVDSIRFFIEQGRTNFPRPVPWPWRFGVPRTDLWSAAQMLGIGVCFVLTVAFFALGGVGLLTRAGRQLRRQPLLTAAVVIGAVYTHHAFSRPDLAHLGPSIPPLLLGLAALPAAQAGRAARRAVAIAVGLLLVAITAATAVPAQPLYRQLASHAFVPYTVAGEELQLRPGIADFLGWVERTAAARIPPGAPILLAPNMPGLYPILHRRSPVWDVYPIWPAAGRLDRRMADELRDHHVDWAFLQDARVDNQDDLMFRHTHPETWRYLSNHLGVAAVWQPAHPTRCVLLGPPP